MLSNDIKRKIKHIKILTRKILSGGLIGDQRVSQKGYGLEFEQLADYQLGDDIRFIDWNSSARTGKLLIKEYREERSHTIFLVVDYSGSSLFATNEQLKKDLIAQLASVLTLVGNYAKNQIGLIIFSDEVELTIPPGHGNQHVHKILTTLFSYSVRPKKTSIKRALEHIISMKRKDTIIFIISDFIDKDYEHQLKLLAKKTEVVAIRCLDKNEYHLPSVGLLQVADIETNTQLLIDVRKKNNIAHRLLSTFLNEQTNYFKKYGIDYLDIYVNSEFVLDLIRFMRKRMSY